MGTRTISLTDEAYHRLKRLKKGKESFSEVVVRLTGKGRLRRFAGTISEDFARELDRSSESFRTKFDEDARRRLG